MLLVATIAGAAGSHALPLVDELALAQLLDGGRRLGAAPGIVGVAPYGVVTFMVAGLAFAASPWLKDD